MSAPARGGRFRRGGICYRCDESAGGTDIDVVSRDFESVTTQVVSRERVIRRLSSRSTSSQPESPPERVIPDSSALF